MHTQTYIYRLLVYLYNNFKSYSTTLSAVNTCRNMN